MRYYRLKLMPRVRLAGQITGVEGYLESAATGLAAALYLLLERRGGPFAPLPATTALGSLARHLTESDPRRFQPANVNYGLFPALAGRSLPRRPPRGLRRSRPNRPRGLGGRARPRGQGPGAAAAGRIARQRMRHTTINALPRASRLRARDVGAHGRGLRRRSAALRRVRGRAISAARPRVSVLADLDTATIRGFLAELALRRGVSRRSQGRALSALRTFFRWAAREGLVKANPAMHLQAPKAERTLARHLRPAEIELLLAAPTGTRPAGRSRPRHPRAALRQRPARRRAGVARLVRSRPARPRAPRRRQG